MEILVGETMTIVDGVVIVVVSSSWWMVQGVVVVVVVFSWYISIYMHFKFCVFGYCFAVCVES